MNALEVFKKTSGNQSADVANSLGELGLVLADLGRPDEAEALLCQALDMRRTILGEDSPLVASSLEHLAAFFRDRGRLDEAEMSARQSLVIREKKADDWRAANARSLLGSILVQRKQYAAAEPLLLAAYRTLEPRAERSGPDLHRTAEGLSQLYHATSRPDQAADWERKASAFDQAVKARRSKAPIQLDRPE